ncbi:src kinase-associated phosphoprotein 2 isoform X2 [Pleurodeles waltl]|uniref:src kinase-associated phosphoprotein 2 isoform X2 n=1 Tax=Pleurodeles waltl TaxID=8319 RepID=UPI003709B858
MHPAIPEDVKTLLADLETFISDILKGENLSKKAKERKDVLLKKIKDVKSNYPQEFQDKGDSSDQCDEYEGLFPEAPDNISLPSDRGDKDDDAPADGTQYPPIAAQELTVILKSGYLEKRRKDHSFFGSEWQKRWCALSNNVFYYYGSDKDKQQKGEFSVEGYTVKLNNTLRKDGKKDCCFEISAPDKRIYQFAAATPKEAEEWVQEIDFVIKDSQCSIIPEDTEEGEQYDDVGSSSTVTPPKRVPPQAIIEPGDEIYEELPEDEGKVAVPETKPPPPKKIPDTVSSTTPVNKSTDYANLYQGLWDCSGDYPDELSFKHGDTIYILNKVLLCSAAKQLWSEESIAYKNARQDSPNKDEYNKFGWWVGEMNGAIGLVPKEYITEMYDI